MTRTLRAAALAASTLAALAVALPAAAHERGRPHTHATPAAQGMSLQQAVAGPWRDAADVARDGQRHPAATLAFWGVRPNMRVVEIRAGGGYWTDILAPYLAAGGGTLIPTFSDPANMTDAQRAARDRFMAPYLANPQLFGTLQPGIFDPRSTQPITTPGSVDLIISSRNWHGFYLQNIRDYAVRAMFDALRPGGLVAIEQHRGDPTRANDPASGYIRQDRVFADMLAAGFQFVGSSEINANPADTRDHPFGVWTLPPTRRTSPQGQPDNPAFDRTRFDAIGESDRMTLLFRKPG